MKRQLTLSVNGRPRQVEADAHHTLLEVLRRELRLVGAREGCGVGMCGACTVLVDGQAARACALPIRSVEGREIVTLEGLGSVDAPHPLQQAFIDAQAAQCGYCISGMVMTAKAFLDVRPNPSEAEVRAALRHNLCRCGTHVEIVKAVLLAAERSRQDAAAS